jgi:hypothetical protein
MATPPLDPATKSPGPPRPRRSRALVALVILLGLAGFGAIREWTNRRLIAMRATAAAAAKPVSLATDVTRLYHRDKVAFASRSADMAARMLRSSPEHAGLKVDDRATVTDVGPTLRVAIGYRGVVTYSAVGQRAVDGEIRQYFHGRGLDVIRATCVTARGPCSDRASLLAQAERALLDHLDDVGPVGVLPDGGRCEASRDNIAGTAAAQSMTCVYGERLELDLRRITDSDARRVVSALAGDPAFRGTLGPQP